MAKRLTDEEILAQLPAARREHRRSMREDPHAASASVDIRSRTLHVQLTNGCSFSIPVDAIPALRGISNRDLVDVEVDPYGYGLRWDRPDMDLSVAGLARVALGGTHAMRVLGAAGGSARTPAKAAAARKNGRKGGRPRQRI